MWLSVVERLDWDVRVANGVRAALAERLYAGQDVFCRQCPDRLDCPRRAGQAHALFRRQHRLVTTRQGRPPVTGFPGPTLPTVEAGIADRKAWLTDQAKVRVYEVLGERPKAVAIMERRLLWE